jgi:hypothetical protein
VCHAGPLDRRLEASPLGGIKIKKLMERMDKTKCFGFRPVKPGNRREHMVFYINELRLIM